MSMGPTEYDKGWSDAMSEVVSENERRYIREHRQLDALPMKSIIIHQGRPFRRRFDDVWQEWGGYDYEAKDIPLPALVIWQPGVVA